MRMVTKTNLKNAILKEKNTRLEEENAELVKELKCSQDQKAEAKAQLEKLETSETELARSNEELVRKNLELESKIKELTEGAGQIRMKKRGRRSKFPDPSLQRSEGISLDHQESDESQNETDIVDTSTYRERNRIMRLGLLKTLECFPEDSSSQLSDESELKRAQLEKARKEVKKFNTDRKRLARDFLESRNY